MNSIPLYNLVRISASGAVKGAPGAVQKVTLYGGSANSSVKFTNDATGVGTDLCGVNTLANTSNGDDYRSVGGVDFDTKIYAVLAGTGAVAYVWYS